MTGERTFTAAFDTDEGVTYLSAEATSLRAAYAAAKQMAETEGWTLRGVTEDES